MSAKILFKTKLYALRRIKEVSAEKGKDLEFLLRDAMQYYYFLGQSVSTGNKYCFFKEPDIVVEQATSIHGLVYKSHDEIPFSEIKCTATYEKNFAQMVKGIAQVTSSKNEDVLSSMILTYGDAIYYLRKGYRPGLITPSSKFIKIQCELTRLFLLK